MCFHLFSHSKKRRYPATAYTDPRPRKKYVSHQQTPAYARYEPLRGHGVKRDHSNPPVVHPVLRGPGVKRSPQRRQTEHYPSHHPSEHRRTYSKRSGESGSTRRHHGYRNTDYPVPSTTGYHSRRSYASDRVAPVRISHNPVHNFPTTDNYYLDICGRQRRINQVVEATIYEPTKPVSSPKYLRRQPGYSRLRYQASQDRPR